MGVLMWILCIADPLLTPGSRVSGQPGVAQSTFGASQDTFDPNLHTLSGLLSDGFANPSSMLSVKSEDRVGLEDALEQLVNRPDSVDTERHSAPNDLASLDNIKVEELRETEVTEVKIESRSEVKVEVKLEAKVEVGDGEASGVAMETADGDNIDAKPSSSVDSGVGSVTSPPAVAPPPKVKVKKGQ